MIHKSHSIKLYNDITLSITEYLPIDGNDHEVIIFLNSSFFNQYQWKRALEILYSLLPIGKKFRFITYDYSGIGKSTYIPRKLSINNFLEEFNAVVRWTKKKSVHVFGMSIGAWVGLNLCIHSRNIIKSFAGYGNLAPYISNFKELRYNRFQSIESSFIHLNPYFQDSINQSNWDVLFKNFYIPVFFQNLQNNNSTENSKRILSKLIYPNVEGNKIALIPDYFNYITNTMIEEGKKLVSKFSNNLKIPILFMNGKKDTITFPKMTKDLHKKIHHSEIKIFEDLGHGSILLGKGNRKIMEKYIQFLTHLSPKI